MSYQQEIVGAGYILLARLAHKLYSCKKSVHSDDKSAQYASVTCWKCHLLPNLVVWIANLLTSSIKLLFFFIKIPVQYRGQLVSLQYTISVVYESSQNARTALCQTLVKFYFI